MNDSMMEAYQESKGRPCPYIQLHQDNEEAATLATYLGSDGWRQQLGVLMLHREIEREPEGGVALMHRVSNVLGSREYRAAVEEHAKKEQAKRRQQGGAQ